MIINKSWQKTRTKKKKSFPYYEKYEFGRESFRYKVDIYTGWFLFGLIPLYITKNSRYED